MVSDAPECTDLTVTAEGRPNMQDHVNFATPSAPACHLHMHVTPYWRSEGADWFWTQSLFAPFDGTAYMDHKIDLRPAFPCSGRWMGGRGRRWKESDLLECLLMEGQKYRSSFNQLRQNGIYRDYITSDHWLWTHPHEVIDFARVAYICS